LACELSKQGVTLILWDINEDENKKTYEALRELGHRRMYLYKVDLANENDVRENAKNVIEKHGFVSVVVLSAATPCDIIGLFERPTSNILRKNESFSSYQLAEAFKLFYQSNLWLYQEFLPQMKERNTGHFVLVSSESVHLNVPQMSTYSCLKAAQTKLIETFDTELNQNDKLNKIKTSVVYLGPLKGGNLAVLGSVEYYLIFILNTMCVFLLKSCRHFEQDHQFDGHLRYKYWAVCDRSQYGSKDHSRWVSQGQSAHVRSTPCLHCLLVVVIVAEEMLRDHRTRRKLVDTTRIEFSV
jgi:short-subunit dehydrogenase